MSGFISSKDTSSTIKLNVFDYIQIGEFFIFCIVLYFFYLCLYFLDYLLSKFFHDSSISLDSYSFSDFILLLLTY